MFHNVPQNTISDISRDKNWFVFGAPLIYCPITRRSAVPEISMTPVCGCTTCVGGIHRNCSFTSTK